MKVFHSAFCNILIEFTKHRFFTGTCCSFLSYVPSTPHRLEYRAAACMSVHHLSCSAPPHTWHGHCKPQASSMCACWCVCDRRQLGVWCCHRLGCGRSLLSPTNALQQRMTTPCSGMSRNKQRVRPLCMQGTTSTTTLLRTTPPMYAWTRLVAMSATMSAPPASPPLQCMYRLGYAFWNLIVFSFENHKKKKITGGHWLWAPEIEKIVQRQRLCTVGSQCQRVEYVSHSMFEVRFSTPVKPIYSCPCAK